MINSIDVKSVEAVICGINNKVFFKDMQNLFRLFLEEQHTRTEKNPKQKEKYKKNIYSLNEIEIQSNLENSQKKDKDKKKINKYKQYPFTFFDGSNLLINFLFSISSLIFDPLIDYYFLSKSEILIYTCNLDVEGDFDNTMTIYKKFNSDFNYSKLNYFTFKTMFKNEEFVSQSKLGFLQDIVNYQNSKKYKLKIFLVFYSDNKKIVNKKFKNHSEFFKNENVTLFHIDKNNKKNTYISILLEILKFKYDITNERDLLRSLKSSLYFR